MTNLRLFTSESVTEGHPDKVCDQISDTILDAMLEQDPNSRVAVETMVTTGLVHLAGEVTTEGYVEIPQLVRQKISEIGYNSSDVGFDGESCGVSVSIGQQSSDIAAGVDAGYESRELSSVDRFDAQGAGDQGIMFGYATDETDTYMPLALELSHLLLRELAAIRKEGKVMKYLRPDAKSQVTIRYSDRNVPEAIDTIVISTQHDDFADEKPMQERITADIKRYLIPRIKKQLPRRVQRLFNADVRYLINPTGKFVIGGPHGDTGLTGRKIIVDTYGGACPHGGGAFSGKDPSKVDRSAAYAARYVAKNIVAAGLAEKCQIQVAYAIGVARPMNITVNTLGTGKVSDEKLSALVAEHFDLRPKGIIQMLDLLRPIYSKTAAYGHFGRDEPEFTWEKTDKAAALRAAAGL